MKRFLIAALAAVSATALAAPSAYAQRNHERGQTERNGEDGEHFRRGGREHGPNVEAPPPPNTARVAPVEQPAPLPPRTAFGRVQGNQPVIDDRGRGRGDGQNGRGEGERGRGGNDDGQGQWNGGRGQGDRGQWTDNGRGGNDGRGQGDHGQWNGNGRGGNDGRGQGDHGQWTGNGRGQGDHGQWTGNGRGGNDGHGQGDHGQWNGGRGDNNDGRGQGEHGQWNGGRGDWNNGRDHDDRGREGRRGWNHNDHGGDWGRNDGHDNRYNRWRNSHRDFNAPRYRDWRHVRHGYYFDRGYALIVGGYFSHNYYWWGYDNWRRPHRRYIVGHYLPDYLYWDPVPYDLYYRLPPAPYGCRYVMVDRDILLIAVATGLILDALIYY